MGLPPFTEVQTSRVAPWFVEVANLGEIGLKGRVLRRQLVEFKPQADVLTAGSDKQWAHNPSNSALK